MSLVDLGKRLLDAAKKGDTEEVRALMSNGAPFTTDWLGTSPLHFAAQNGHLSTAEVLLRAGISRDARTKVDRTPLHVASQEGHITIVELLLRNGADIEAKDMLKMTPLHWSVEKGHIDVVDILVKNGADMNCENKFDKSPLDIAITNGRTDLAQILHLQQNPIVEVVTTDTTETVEEDGLETETVVTEAVSTPVVISPQPVALVANSSHKTITTESTDQSSTSVLATLAALAEATAPLNASSTTSTTAAEALTWLETHGITMISNSDASTAVTSSLEHTGQTLTLTEAGKLALNFVKHQNSDETETIEETVVDGTVEHVEIGNSGTQKVITIVADQGQLEGAAGDGPVVVTMATEDVQTEMEAETEGSSGEPALKKLRVSDEGLSSGNTSSDQEELRRQLEEVQKQAEEYKQQLMKKEQEAEVYKKQLNEITNKGSGE